MSLIRPLAVIMLLTLSFSKAPLYAQQVTGSHDNLFAAAVNAGQFKTLVSAVERAGLTETLKNDGPFTLFAPNDAAFAHLRDNDLNALNSDPEALAKLLQYHLIGQRLPLAEIAQQGQLTTLEGGAITIENRDGVRVGEAKIISPDIATGNGIIHIIDRVLMPPSLE